MTRDPATRRRFQPGWKLTVFVVLLLPLLIRLGFWQLHRADEKRAILATYDARRHAPPVKLEDLQGPPKRYQRISVNGRFLNDRAFLLDNRVYQGQPGFEVITPAVTAATGQVVFVDRGWIAGFEERSKLPAIPPVPGDQSVTGEVYTPDFETVPADEWASAGWPKVIQSLDVKRMAAALNRRAFGEILRLPPESPWSFRQIWQPINMPPSRHIGYAVQWFCMAVVLAALYIATGFGWMRRGSRRNRTQED